MLNILERALRFQRIHGTRRLFSEGWLRVRRKLAGAPSQTLLPAAPPPPGAPPAPVLPDDHFGWVSVHDLVRHHSRNTTPLQLFTSPAPALGRLTLVTDSINRGSLYGGVGTAAILAALLARARGQRLRILTRTERANPGGLQTVLDSNGITLEHEVEFAFAPDYDERQEVDTYEGELFMTTSWWTTAATLATLPVERVVYLLQEDERMFYPYGDEHLRCSRTLAHPGLTYVINTRLLFDHLRTNGLPQLETQAQWFEPAFPRSVFYPRQRDAGGKRKLMFYARPNNARNLFFLGLQVLERAIEQGVLDLEQWDVVFVGKDIPKIRLDNGRYSPKRLENLDWRQYAQLAGTTDLALCLMYTPHPSYPPFDLAASGAVVVTNRFANKQSLDMYCRNILLAEPEPRALVATLGDAIRLAQDTPTREANHQAAQLGTDWQVALADVVAQLAKR